MDFPSNISHAKNVSDVPSGLSSVPPQHIILANIEATNFSNNQNISNIENLDGNDAM